VRRIRRASLAVGIRVVLAELGEFLFDTTFSPRGTLDRIPGEPRRGAAVTPSRVGGDQIKVR
jgi:hypothetical protein